VIYIIRISCRCHCHAVTCLPLLLFLFKMLYMDKSYEIDWGERLCSESFMHVPTSDERHKILNLSEAERRPAQDTKGKDATEETPKKQFKTIELIMQSPN
jgi:hypothetical protein